MEKRLIRKSIPFHFGWFHEDGVSIEQLKEDVLALETLGAQGVKISAYTNEDVGEEPRIIMDAFCMREETDEEFEYRVGRDQRLKDLLKKAEIEAYYRIKEKYNL